MLISGPNISCSSEVGEGYQKPIGSLEALELRKDLDKRRQPLVWSICIYIYIQCVHIYINMCNIYTRM